MTEQQLSSPELHEWIDTRASATAPVGDRLERLDQPIIQPVTLVDPDFIATLQSDGERLAGKAWDAESFGDEFPIVEAQLAEIELQRQVGLGALYHLLRLLEAIPAGDTVFFLWAALRRTTELARGFDEQMRALNLSVAASLPRFQVDNFLRVFAVNLELTQDPPAETIARSINSGERLNKVPDPFVSTKPNSGRRKPKMLSDQRLKELASDWPWVESVYSESSRWVHMSNRHSGTAFRFIDDQRFVGSTGSVPNLVDESLLADVAWAMLQPTTAVTNICASLVLETSRTLRRVS